MVSKMNLIQFLLKNVYGLSILPFYSLFDSHSHTAALRCLYLIVHKSWNTFYPENKKIYVA